MPLIILIACAWIIGSIAKKSQRRRKLEQAEKARQESIARVNAAMEAERANRERIAREKQAEKAEKERAARQKAIDAVNKKRLSEMKKAAAEAEKAEKAERERLYKINLAKREIDYCNNILADLNKRLDSALIDLEFAQLANYSGDKLYKVQKPVDDLKANIYRTENRIEKAYHTLSMCNA